MHKSMQRSCQNNVASAGFSVSHCITDTDGQRSEKAEYERRDEPTATGPAAARWPSINTTTGQVRHATLTETSRTFLGRTPPSPGPRLMRLPTIHSYNERERERLREKTSKLWRRQARADVAGRTRAASSWGDDEITCWLVNAILSTTGNK